MQADSPTRSDAFWKTTPVKPTTVLAAKFAGIFVIVLPLLVAAEIVALELNGIRFEQALVFSLKPSLTVALTLPPLMLIAAVTPNFKSFISGIILLVTFSTLVSNTGFVTQSGREVNEVPWLQAMAYLLPFVAVVALCLTYVSKWTIDQSRVIAVAALVVVPVLHIFLQAGALSIVRRARIDEKLLPASRYRASIVGDAIVVKFAIKAPVSNVKMDLANSSARVKLSSGWYRLGTNSTSPGFERLVGPAFRRGEVSTTGLQIGDTFSKAAIVDGDSLRITLEFRFDPTVRTLIQESNSPVSMSGTLIVSDLHVLLNVPADTQYHYGTFPGIDIGLMPVPDSGTWLRVQGRSLGRSGNSVGDAFLGDEDSALAQQLKSYGYYSSAFTHDTAMLVAQSGSDTVRFRRYGRGAGWDDIVLPIPFTVIHGVKADLRPDSASAGVDLHDFVKHARFEYHGWKYLNHIRLVADVALTRP